MERKRILLALVTMLLMISMVACERPASRAPTTTDATATTEDSFPVPGVTEDVMGQLESFATQTAMAMLGTPASPAVPETTPPPDVSATQAPAEPTQAAPEATQAAPVATQAAPAATSAPPAAATTPFVSTIPASWTLQKGEHPYCIARRYNVNPDEMLRVSGLNRSGSYPPGTVLKIPQTGNTFPANRSLKAHPTTYTVVSGDTIYSIACEFGDVDPFAIAAANNLGEPYRLEAGQKLNIP